MPLGSLELGIRIVILLGIVSPILLFVGLRALWAKVRKAVDAPGGQAASHLSVTCSTTRIGPAIANVAPALYAGLRHPQPKELLK